MNHGPLTCQAALLSTTPLGIAGREGVKQVIDSSFFVENAPGGTQRHPEAPGGTHEVTWGAFRCLWAPPGTSGCLGVSFTLLLLFPFREIRERATMKRTGSEGLETEQLQSFSISCCKSLRE